VHAPTQTLQVWAGSTRKDAKMKINDNAPENTHAAGKYAFEEPCGWVALNF
jgi:hypothetical protein